MVCTIRFRYYLLIDKDGYIVLYDREREEVIKKSIGFKDMYDFIFFHNIPYQEIKLKGIDYYILFDYFIDESSINPDIKKGGRI